MGGAAVQMSIDPPEGSPAPANDPADNPFFAYQWNARGDLRCPHCKAQAIRRTSREVTPTFREIFYVCGNAACGHTFKASLSYDYGLSPSAIPDPAVDLPLRPLAREDVIKPDPPPDDPSQPRLF